MGKIICSPLCARRWKEARDNNESTENVHYQDWLQAELYRTCSECIDLVEVLHVATTENHPECLSKLLDLGFCPDGRLDSTGYTPLIEASKLGHSTCIEVLLAAGAQVNRRATDKSTALMHAIKFGYLWCVKLLCSAGADVNMRCKMGFTFEVSALSLAAYFGQICIFRILLRKTKNPRDLHWLMDLVSNKPFVYVSKILDYIIEHIDGVPLCIYKHIAFADKHLILRHLIKQKMPLMEFRGRQADIRKLAICCMESPVNGGVSCLKELLNNQNNISFKINQFDFDCTLLEYACAMLNEKAVEYLLSLGVNVDVASSVTGESPLKACIQSTVDNPITAMRCLAILIRHGCDVQNDIKVRSAFPPGEHWMTPLEYAICGKNLFAAKMLLTMYKTNPRPQSLHLRGSLREVIISYILQHPHEERVAFIREACSPFSLLHLARVAVRESLGYNPHGKVLQLPIPHTLKNCVNLMELDDMITDFTLTIQGMFVQHLAISDSSDE